MKNIAASVLNRLKNQSKEEGIPFQMVLQLFVQEEFLRKLALSEYVDNLILKGGMFIYTLTEFDSRPTRDIDFLIKKLCGSLENIEQTMRDICNISTGNDFVSPEVFTYSLESTIAEKFDAILQRMAGTSRMKDFYDIYYLSGIFDFEGEILIEAVKNTLIHRNRELSDVVFAEIADFK
ncbi:MAG TPA: nucleotidyl transferase AbiEii/AbiGii toxin family protein, partial [Candidatus Blautia faecigallinarum]|nr:nucleotidyl transferase AbiEii/AbiGii toxin family protein [Candidatus Blautia faecigallinarum]